MTVEEGLDRALPSAPAFSEAWARGFRTPSGFHASCCLARRVRSPVGSGHPWPVASQQSRCAFGRKRYVEHPADVVAVSDS